MHTDRVIEARSSIMVAQRMNSDILKIDIAVPSDFRANMK